MQPQPAVDKHPLLDSALRRMHSRGPHLSILGPFACGKTKLLKSLIVHLRCFGFDDQPCKCVKIDLRNLVPEPHDGMRSQLLHMLRTAGREQNLSAETAADLEECLRDFANAVDGFLILAVDHLDDVPYELAAEFVQHIRNLKEKSEGGLVRARVGILLCGSVSLFRLRRHGDSGLAQVTPFTLPPLSPEIRKSLVSYALGNRRVSDNVLQILADETGGEQSFLSPILSSINGNGGQLTVKSVRDAIKSVAFHELPVVRRVLIALLCNEKLAGVAIDVASGVHRALGVQNPDVHPYQLEGVLVADTACGCFQMRNRIVASLVKELGTMEAPAPTVQLRAGIADLLDIRQLPQRVLLAEDLWSTTPYLLRAWEVATPQEWACPRFHLALSRSGREPHWFELIALPEGPGPLTPPTVVAKAHALTCVSHRPEFAWDASLVSYAVHGHWRDLEASLCVTAAKADAPFTETGLGPWTAFAQRALPALIRQAVTWCGLAERREAECPATPTPTYDIFLSHSSIDSVKARIIYNKATALNLRVYFSPVDLEPGQRFSEELRQALVASAEVWLLASEASLASVWVHTEWGAAWVLQKKIVPILYRIGPSKLPDRLQELQVVDLDSIDEPLKQLAQASNRQAKAAGR